MCYFFFFSNVALLKKIHEMKESGLPKLKKAFDCYSLSAHSFSILECDPQLNEIAHLLTLSTAEQPMSSCIFLENFFLGHHSTMPESYTLILNTYIHCHFLYSLLLEAINTFPKTAGVVKAGAASG